ncbi:hypothetical protein IMG5_154450 [Ichthyophthirius multifiliis]|uniref:Transmembrane protein n=1 Tax=Ichthyophthirius multifiliis TaxID=5932 RepID=G0QZ48_ICHMU|nr:hypothetical protein IMG5_154450 [Ichthyophthirius multifiliis]EGR29499.1 hypothetical protein IMG5_154450 [Ichthyophthirius multifiliis]|eukprot:XP_004030735.1 hypothetical protein IMG5_154450 [Ichthyophthirius multifiliis]
MILQKLIHLKEKNIHFILCQLCLLFFIIIITSALQLFSKEAIYLFYCFPILFIYMFLHYFLFWYSQKELKRFYAFFYIINIVQLIIFSVIFFSIYFLIFYKVQQYDDFQKVENCQIQGKQSKNLSGNEQYSINYVEIEYEDIKYLGYGCMSNQNEQNKIIQNIKPYYKTQKKKTNTQAKTQNNNENQIDDQDEDSCLDIYTFSKVKIASWMCQSNNLEFQELIKPRSCYIYFFGNKEKALENGINRQQIKDINDFILVSFNYPYHYPQNQFLCLIIFGYFPFIQSFGIIFYKFAFYLLKKFQKNKQAHDLANSEDAKTKVSSNEVIQNQKILQQNVLNQDIENEIKSLQNDKQEKNQINKQNINPNNNYQIDQNNQYLSQQINFNENKQKL